MEVQIRVEKSGKNLRSKEEGEKRLLTWNCHYGTLPRSFQYQPKCEMFNFVWTWTTSSIFWSPLVCLAVSKIHSRNFIARQTEFLEISLLVCLLSRYLGYLGQLFFYLYLAKTMSPAKHIVTNKVLAMTNNYKDCNYYQN